jgi:hypothetical protein
LSLTLSFPVARFRLLGLFLASFAISILIVGITYLRGAMYANHLQQLVLAILAVYSVPLGTILGGMYGERGRSKGRTSTSTFWVAAAVATIWNLLLVVRVVLFAVASEDSVEDFTAYLSAVSASSSFLVVAALAFFFTNKEPA